MDEKITRKIKNTINLIRFYKNWFEILFFYLGFKKRVRVIKMRGGISVNPFETRETLDTLNEIFIKDVYKIKNTNLRENPIIIDVGANIGIFSLFCLKTLKNPLIYSYEPTKRAYEKLAYNLHVNGFSEVVKTNKKGLMNKIGKEKIFLDPEYSISDGFCAKKGESEEVEVITLKGMLEENKLKKVDLLKLDIEGAEFSVLRDCPKEVFDLIERIHLEIHFPLNSTQRQEIIFKLEKNKFKTKILVDGGVTYLFVFKDKNKLFNCLNK
jgi:FkbM family methyltransferase